MEEMVNFWKGKKVFITGHTGFKGGWLALWLTEMQADVTGFALEPPTESNFFSATQLSNHLNDIRGDVRDYAALANALRAQQPEIVFHVAAQSLVRYSYQNPVETYASNIMGTVHLLEAVRHMECVRAVVNVTSDKCYENNDSVNPFTENALLGGRDPYSSSKGCSELITRAYRDSYFKEKIAVATARAGNVIGGGDWAQDRLLPDLVSACIERKAISIRYPEAIRPWQHVLEPVSGYLRLAEKLFKHRDEFAEAWNFGPMAQDSRSVRWLASEVLRLWGSDIQWQLAEGAHPHEAMHLTLDCSKAEKKLQWQPKWAIGKALAATVDWYQAFYRGENMREFSINQIKDYA